MATEHGDASYFQTDHFLSAHYVPAQCMLGADCSSEQGGTARPQGTDRRERQELDK